MELKKIIIDTAPGKSTKKKSPPRRSPPAKDRPVSMVPPPEKPPPIKIKLNLKSLKNQQPQSIPSSAGASKNVSSSQKRDPEKLVGSVATQLQILLAQQEYEKRRMQSSADSQKAPQSTEPSNPPIQRPDIKANMSQNPPAQVQRPVVQFQQPQNIINNDKNINNTKLTPAQITALQYQLMQSSNAIRPMPPPMPSSQVAPQFLQMARYAKNPQVPQKRRPSQNQRPPPSRPPISNIGPPQQQQGRYQPVKMVKSTYSNRIKTAQVSNALVNHAAIINGETETEEWMPPMATVKDRILARSTPIRFTKYTPTSEDVLIPVTFEVELRPGVYLKDSFTWNISDTTMKPRNYAELLGFDLELSPAIVDSVAAAIQQQIDYYTPAAVTANVIPLHDSHNKRKRDHKEEKDDDDDDETTTNIPVTLEVQVGRRLIRDRFLWDSSPNNPITPEHYAKIFVADYGLGGETVPMLATSIREQILIHAQQEYLLPFDDFDSSTRSEMEGIVLDVQEDSEEVVIVNNQLCQTTVIDRLTKQELVDLAYKRDRQARRMRRETTRLKRRAHY